MVHQVPSGDEICTPTSWGTPSLRLPSDGAEPGLDGLGGVPYKTVMLQPVPSRRRMTVRGVTPPPPPPPASDKVERMTTDDLILSAETEPPPPPTRQSSTNTNMSFESPPPPASDKVERLTTDDLILSAETEPPPPLTRQSSTNTNMSFESFDSLSIFGSLVSSGCVSDEQLKIALDDSTGERDGGQRRSGALPEGTHGADIWPS